MTRRKIMLGGVLFVILLSGMTGGAWAANNSACFGCHEDAGLAKQDASGKKTSLYVSEVHYKSSVHGEFACSDCHTQIKDDTHAAGGQTRGRVNCGSCHEKVDREYRQSLHGKSALKGVAKGVLCSDCHGKHAIYPANDKRSMVHPSNIGKTCDRCHADKEFTRKHALGASSPGELFEESVHGKTREVSCKNCHGTHDVKSLIDPKSSIFRSNVPQTCGGCHPEITQQFIESVHGVLAARGRSDSPTCTTCHGIHGIKAKVDPDSATNERRIILTTCPQCHAAERISKEYGITKTYVESYYDSFHGLSYRGGDSYSANCASCHGVHDIRSSSDPKSQIHRDNLQKTCGSCHPGASANFAKGKIHTVASISGDDFGERAAGWVRVFYIILIVTVIGGMVLFNSTDWLRKTVERRYYRRGGEIGGPEAMKRYLRMTWDERVQHLNLMINFTLLVITGFALKHPEVFSAFGGGSDVIPLRGFLHRLCGVALITLGGYHVLYLIFTERGRGILRDMVPQLKDGKDLWETLKKNLFIDRSAKEIKMGRFGYREKLEYLALVWGTVVMTVTGFILWLEVEWLKYFPRWTFDVARAIHYYEAILATLAIIIWHFYSVIFDPDVYPMNWAWITGDITEEEMRKEHGLEMERIRAKEKLRPERIRSLDRSRAEGSFSPRRLVESIRNVSEMMKNWDGTTKAGPPRR